MAEQDDWIKFQDGKYVSRERFLKTDTDFSQMEMHGSVFPKETEFTLTDALKINFPDKTFGLRNLKHGLEFNDWDTPIEKFVKAVIAYGRVKGINVNVPTNIEYIDMMLEVAYGRKAGDEDLASLYDKMQGWGLDLTRDILEFHELIDSGANKGKYLATLLRFDGEGNLKPIEDVTVAGEGDIREIDNYGIPTETSREQGSVGNVFTGGLDEIDTRGRLYLRGTRYPLPENGDQRLVYHVRGFYGSGNFCTYITKDISERSNSLVSFMIRREE